MSVSVKSVAIVFFLSSIFILGYDTREASARKVYKSCYDAYKFRNYGIGKWQKDKKYVQVPEDLPKPHKSFVWCDATEPSIEDDIRYTREGSNRYITNANPEKIRDYYLKTFEKNGYKVSMFCGLFGNYVIHFNTPDRLSGGHVDIGTTRSIVLVKYMHSAMAVTRIKGKRCKKKKKK